MVKLSVEQIAAINRLANVLGPLVTNAVIKDMAEQLGLLRSMTGSNKEAKIASLLAPLLDDTDNRKIGAALIGRLTMAAHGRAVRKQVEMTEEDADAIVSEMRRLRLPAADLAQKGWRTGLKSSPVPTPVSDLGKRGEVSNSIRPIVHERALLHVRSLVDPTTNPQSRGRQLEYVLLGVLQEEKLGPEHRLVIPGEEMDLSFVLDGQHYLVECKWEHGPIGLPPLELFSTKVRRKAEGTFGVVLSMSGYVSDINDRASRGERLNCVGLSHQHLMAVLEGRATWSETVRRARRSASDKSRFLE